MAEEYDDRCAPFSGHERTFGADDALLLLLGYGSNQVNVLWKLIIIATNRDPQDPVDSRVSGAQTQIIVRLLIGVLREVWRTIEARFMQCKLSRDFVRV